MSAPTTTDVVLHVDHIDFSYGLVQVLFDVSLDVHGGESLALLGTNGAGKSTLLKVVAGLARPQRGAVTFGDRDIATVRPERLAADGLALIPGGKAVFTDMSVAENLEIHALPIRHDRKLVADRIDEVFACFPRLAERRSSLAGRLSGGEQQQLALARAIVLDPPVLCIDELSLGLAPIIVGELIAFVRTLQAKGTTLILVEQSLNIAAQLCERAVFLEKGQIRFEGRTAELLERDDIARAVFLGGA